MVCIPLLLKFKTTLDLAEASHYLKALPLVDPKSIAVPCLPYHNSLLELCDSVNTVSTSIQCKLCQKEMDIKGMRRHIGAHILLEELKDVCGFCGVAGCSIGIAKSSGYGKTATMSATSNCIYKSKFSLQAATKSTRSGPCTNRPLDCNLCPPNTVVWKYNVRHHFDLHHAGVLIPPDCN